MQRITVLLAEDHIIVREGLRVLVEAEGDIEVIGEASDGREALRLAASLHPSVVVMDVTMPLLNGLEATRQILKVYPTMRVLILSAYRDDEYVIRAMAEGAVGYLVKHESSKLLVRAIREAHRGNTFFDPSVAGRLRTANKKAKIRLTSREAEILQLVAEGKANKQIASYLDISIKTVEKHRQHLMDKLDIHDTAGLTRYAIETGVIVTDKGPNLV
jgi:DNA-binding NarL/FixJ family response regulator